MGKAQVVLVQTCMHTEGRNGEWGGGGGEGGGGRGVTLTESYKRERSLWGEPEGKKQRGQALKLEEQRPHNPEGWMECEMEPPVMYVSFKQ